MGFNSNCSFQTCGMGCCNFYGYCPEDYDPAHYSSYYTKCYHYYDEQSGDTGNFLPYLLCALVAIGMIAMLYLRRGQRNHKNTQNSNLNYDDLI